MEENGHINFDGIESGFVAGSSSGIGLAFVSNLLNRNKGVRIFATYRDEARAKPLRKLQEQQG